MLALGFYALGRVGFSTQSHSFPLGVTVLLDCVSCQSSQNPSKFCKHLIKLTVVFGEVRLCIGSLLVPKRKIERKKKSQNAEPPETHALFSTAAPCRAKQSHDLWNLQQYTLIGQFWSFSLGYASQNQDSFTVAHVLTLMICSLVTCQHGKSNASESYPVISFVLGFIIYKLSRIQLVLQ